MTGFSIADIKAAQAATWEHLTRASDLAYIRVLIAGLKLHLSLKAGFDPAQPRDGHGQWARWLSRALHLIPSPRSALCACGERVRVRGRGVFNRQRKSLVTRPTGLVDQCNLRCREWCKTCNRVDSRPSPRPSPRRSGERDTARVDVHENVRNGTACVYDIKTGKTELSLSRASEIAKAVYSNFHGITRILVIQVRPRR
jgi:hypothetical protein